MKGLRRLKNKGFSLVEIIVAVAILGIATTAIGAFIMTAQRSYNNGSTETDLQYEAQLLSNEMQDLIIDVNRGISYRYNAQAADGEEVLDGYIITDDEIGVDEDDLLEYVKYTKSLYIYNKSGYIVINWDKDTGKITYSTYEATKDETPVSVGNLLAEYVKSFAVDLSEIKPGGDRTVAYTITFEKGDRSYTTTHKIKVRNEVPINITSDIYDDPIDDEVKVGDIVVSPKEIMLWNEESYGSEDGKTITATVSSTGGLLMFKNVNWGIYPAAAGSTSVTAGGSTVEKKDGKVIVTVSKEETAADFYVYAYIDDPEDPVSSLYINGKDEADGMTPEKCLHVWVRKINAMAGTVSYDGTTYTDDTVEIKEKTTGIVTRLSAGPDQAHAFTVAPNPAEGQFHIDEQIKADYSDASTIINNVGGFSEISVTEYYHDANGVLQNAKVTSGSGNVVEKLSIDPATGSISFDLKDLAYEDTSYYDDTRVVIRYRTIRPNTSAEGMTKTIMVQSANKDLIDPKAHLQRDGLLPLDMDALNSIMKSMAKKYGGANPVLSFELYSGHATEVDEEGIVTAMQRSDPDCPRVFNNTISNNGAYNQAGAERITIGGRTYNKYNNNAGDVYLLTQVVDNQVVFENEYYDVQLYLDNSVVFPYSGILVDRYGNVNDNDCLEVQIKITANNGGEVAFDKTYFVPVDPVQIEYSADGATWSSDLDVSLLRGTGDIKSRVYFRLTSGWGGVLGTPQFFNQTGNWPNRFGDDDYNTSELGYDRDSDYVIYLGQGYAGGKKNQAIFTLEDDESAYVDGLINRFNATIFNPNTKISSSYFFKDEGYTNEKWYRRERYSGDWHLDTENPIHLNGGFYEHSSHNDYYKISDYGRTVALSEYDFSKNFGRIANFFSVTQGVSNSDSRIGYLDFTIDKAFADNNSGQTVTLKYEENPYMGHSQAAAWSVMKGCVGSIQFNIVGNNVFPDKLIKDNSNLTGDNKTPTVLCAPLPGSGEWKTDSSQSGVSYYEPSSNERYELILKEGKYYLTYLFKDNGVWVNQWRYRTIVGNWQTPYTGYLEYSDGEYGTEYRFFEGTGSVYYPDNIVYDELSRRSVITVKPEPSSLYAPAPGDSRWIKGQEYGITYWRYEISATECYYLRKVTYDYYFGSFSYYYLTYQTGNNKDGFLQSWYDRDGDFTFLRWDDNAKKYNKAYYYKYPDRFTAYN
ncbi:MAG: prepilin-type N-terminal cleavage/methylation domain-containing protein [Lachnospiraceae bacterium]|nr:prepilin-type N-terminal cleavage/methylation domain-containing protein [Lachnospiraceae bacterium]